MVISPLIIIIVHFRNRGYSHVRFAHSFFLNIKFTKFQASAYSLSCGCLKINNFHHEVHQKGYLFRVGKEVKGKEVYTCYVMHAREFTPWKHEQILKLKMSRKGYHFIQDHNKYSSLSE